MLAQGQWCERKKAWLKAWVSEDFFPGGTLVDFSRGGNSGENSFRQLETKRKAFLY